MIPFSLIITVGDSIPICLSSIDDILPSILEAMPSTKISTGLKFDRDPESISEMGEMLAIRQKYQLTISLIGEILTSEDPFKLMTEWREELE